MGHVAVVIFAAFLAGCVTAFTPTEWPLGDGVIPAFSVAGTVTISNAQSSWEPVIVFSGMGQKLSSDLKTITEVMVQGAQKELQKNGRSTATDGSKSIALKVKFLQSRIIVGAFHTRSRIEFQAALGNGQAIDFVVTHASAVVSQDLNGCIAEGVMTLFKDERVKAYLAS